MNDTIYRADAIEAVCGAVIDEFDVSPTRGYEVAEHALSALPSAEAVSMEEHIKELNDLAVEWKAKFAKAEKITDEIYDETMAKVAKECEECKERLRNIRPSAEAEPKWNCTANFVEEQLEKLKDMTYEERIKLLHILFPSDDAEPSLKAIKRQIDEHWYLDPPSAEAEQVTSKLKNPCDSLLTDDSDGCKEQKSKLEVAEAVQGWIPCSERLPKKGEVVLITNGKGNVRCGQYRSEHDVRGGTHYWWWKGKTVESVLAWMPLPKPYKGGDDE